MFAAFLCTILFSVSVVCGHRSAKLVGPTEANFWRATVATILLGIWAYTRGSGLGGVALGWFVLSGVMGVGVGDTAFFQSLPRLGSGLALLLIECLQAPFGVLIEWLWLGTQLTPRQLLFGAIILAGVGVALAPTEHRKISRKDFILGLAFCTFAAIATASGAVLSRKGYSVQASIGLPIDPGTVAFQRVLGGLLPAALVLLAVKRPEFKVQAAAPRKLVFEVSRKKWKGMWPWVLMNGLAGQTLGVACMQKALETTPTGIVLAIIAVTPIVVIPFAWVFEGDRPSLHSVVGGIVAVGGVMGLLLKG